MGFDFEKLSRESNPNTYDYEKDIAGAIRTGRNTKPKINTIDRNKLINDNKNLIKNYEKEVNDIYRSKEYNELQSWLNTDTRFKKSLLADTYNEKKKRFEELQTKAKELNKKIDEVKMQNIDLEDVSSSDRILAPLNNVYTGVQGTVRGIANAINRISGNEELLYEGITPEEYKAQKVAEEQTGPEKIISGIGGTVGQMLTLAPLSFVPGAGTALSTTALGLSSAGEAYKQGKEEGKEDKEALTYASTVGLSEALMQKLLGGVKVFGKSVAGNKVNKIIDKVVKSENGKKSLNYISDMLGEGTEEYLQSVLEPVYRNIAYKEDNKIDPLNEDAIYSGIIGALSAGAMNAPSYVANRNKVTNDKIAGQNNINIVKKDLNTDNNKINRLNNKTSNIVGNESNNIIYNYIPSKNNPMQKQIAPLSEEAQIKRDSENFAKQVDAVRNGTFAKRDMLTLGRTPKILQELGLKDLPITMTQKHLDTIMNESGKYKGANYHGLGEDIVKKLPEALNNPLDILKSSTKDDSIVLTTDLSDKQDRTIIASIKIDGKGDINNIRIDTNVMTSAYGRNNYDKFMQENIKAGNLLYDIDQGIIKKIDKKTVGERLQLPMRDSSDSSSRLQLPNSTISINNIIPQNENYASSNKKVLNPAEIANLNQEDISTTPKLPNITYKTQEKKNSKFYNNLISKTGMLNDNLRNLIKNENDIRYYEGITNKQSLAEAYNRLNEGGAKETMKWFSKDLKDKNVSISASEVAEGWILLKQYQDVGDYESAVNVAKRMRDMATKSGQALQAYSIQARLTPEGMFHYAQSELQEAFEKFSKNKTKKWIDKHKSDFDLKPYETQAIITKVKEAQQLDDNSYEKREKLAEIQKIMTDKLPPERGAGIKSWMRISMLFNPKTQVRNILGNTVIAPVNIAGDFVSSIADKVLSKKTGIRTTGNTNMVNYAKGFKKGLYESYNDFKKDINTRDINGNRFEIGQGKSFKNRGLGKVLNKVDHLLNFMLDAGDRPFYEATFTNSINNQLVLNNTDIVTQDMIDIATNEALSRTWQDNNAYTKAVLGIRNDLNKLINIRGYGLGDVFIPFAKTPANLTKAIVDYSPVGLVNSIVEGNKVRKAINRGDLTVQQQHKFVQDLGKATAGTMLYVLGYALATAGITSGESDEDKDVSNFIKNNLGISEYSIKIGNKTFTYDWAQPVAAPIAMMANLVGKKQEETNTLNKILDTIDVPLNMLLEQSFMSSIKDVFSNYNGLPQAMFEEISGLPARAVPTFLKQITDMIDTTQRTTYEKGKPVRTAINQIKAKIPILSKELTPVSNTLGEDIKKYGGENDPFLYAFHTFINPANVNSNQKNKAGIEIYNVYKDTGDKTIFPRQADYTQTIDGNKIILTSQERYKYQKSTGKYYSDVVNELLKSDTYNKLPNSEKAEILKEIANDSNEKAKEELAKTKNLDYERPKTDVKIDELVKKGLEYTNAYIYKTQIKDIEGNKDIKGKTITGSSSAKQAKYIMDLDTNDIQKNKLLSLISDTDTILTVSDLKKLDGDYLTYIQQSGKKNKDGVSERDKYMMYIDTGIPVKTLNKYYSEIGKIEGTKNSNGKTITGSKKKAIFNYIDTLNISAIQKKILFTKSNSNYGENYKAEIFKYIDSLNINKQRKEQIWKELYE